MSESRCPLLTDQIEVWSWLNKYMLDLTEAFRNMWATITMACTCCMFLMASGSPQPDLGQMAWQPPHMSAGSERCVKVRQFGRVSPPKTTTSEPKQRKPGVSDIPWQDAADAKVVRPLRLAERAEQ